jgi:hypothetical protein
MAYPAVMVIASAMNILMSTEIGVPNRRTKPTESPLKVTNTNPATPANAPLMAPPSASVGDSFRTSGYRLTIPRPTLTTATPTKKIPASQAHSVTVWRPSGASRLPRSDTPANMNANAVLFSGKFHGTKWVDPASSIVEVGD